MEGESVRRYVRPSERPPEPPFWKEPDHSSVNALPPSAFQIIQLPKRVGDREVYAYRKDGRIDHKIGTVPDVVKRWYIRVIRFVGDEHEQVPYSQHAGNPEGYLSAGEAWSDLGRVIAEDEA